MYTSMNLSMFGKIYVQSLKLRSFSFVFLANNAIYLQVLCSQSGQKKHLVSVLTNIAHKLKTAYTRSVLKYPLIP